MIRRGQTAYALPRRTRAGGSWLYIEIDPGFAWPNVEALFEAAQDLRGGA